MELWLLVGAVILVALTVWIVWPAQRSEEVTAMTNSSQPGSSLPPQGAAFEDQYTSATADLSAGGVATAREIGAPVSSRSSTAAMPESAMRSEPWASPTIAREGVAGAVMPQAGASQGLARPRTIGIGAAAMLMVGGGVGGAWLYQHWQRERARPINRFRRRARDLASRMPDFDFDFDELPEQTAPVSGAAAAAAALLVSSLMIARARRRPEPRDVVRDTIQETRERSRRTLRPPRRRETLLGGLGLGGSALVVGAVWLIWRLLKGHDDGPQHLYITDRMGE